MSVLDHLIKREQQELEAALKATYPHVRQRHLEMADAYTCRIDEMKRQERMSSAIPDARPYAPSLNPQRHEKALLEG